MYKKKLKYEDQIFGKDITLPAAATADCPTALAAAGSGSGLAVTIDAKTPVSLPAASALTVTIKDSADGVAFADVVTYSVAFAQAKTFGVGDVLAQLPLVEKTRRHIKATVGTTKAGTTGTVDVFLEYLAR